jgi:hypothetical protein
MSKKNYNPNDDIPPTVKINPDDFNVPNYDDDYIPPTVKMPSGGDSNFEVPPTVKMPSAGSPSFPPMDNTNDFKTIKITNNSPKTLKFIPGYLEITDGEDRGKRFKISGYPTTEGNIVSIGREEIKGERSYSHIQLLERTVSRKQAEIIERNQKLYIKNYSEINPTRINDEEIPVGEEKELNQRDRIRTGEVEFTYKVEG